MYTPKTICFVYEFVSKRNPFYSPITIEVNRYFVWVKEAMMPLRLGNDDIKIQFSAYQIDHGLEVFRLYSKTSGKAIFRTEQV